MHLSRNDYEWSKIYIQMHSYICMNEDEGDRGKGLEGEARGGRAEGRGGTRGAAPGARIALDYTLDYARI